MLLCFQMGFIKYVLAVVMVLAGVFGIYAAIMGDFSKAPLDGKLPIIIGITSFLIFLGGTYILRKER